MTNEAKRALARANRPSSAGWADSELLAAAVVAATTGVAVVTWTTGAVLDSTTFRPDEFDSMKLQLTFKYRT